MYLWIKVGNKKIRLVISSINFVYQRENEELLVKIREERRIKFSDSLRDSLREPLREQGKVKFSDSLREQGRVDIAEKDFLVPFFSHGEENWFVFFLRFVYLLWLFRSS